MRKAKEMFKYKSDSIPFESFLANYDACLIHRHSFVEKWSMKLVFVIINDRWKILMIFKMWLKNVFVAREISYQLSTIFIGEEVKTEGNNKCND